jgi:WD40 repeat protein
MTFPDHQAIVYGVAAKPDGSVGYSVGSDRQLRSWKPGGEGKQLKASAGHGDEVFKVVFSPRDNLLATASADKSVRLWDPDKLANTKTLAGLADWVYAVAFSPDGKKLAAGGFDGMVVVWNVSDGKPAAKFSASPGFRIADKH